MGAGETSFLVVKLFSYFLKHQLVGSQALGFC